MNAGSIRQLVAAALSLLLPPTCHIPCEAQIHLDSAFGHNGIVMSSSEIYELKAFYGPIALRGEKILFNTYLTKKIGMFPNRYESSPALIQYNNDGSLDHSFGMPDTSRMYPFDVAYGMRRFVGETWEARALISRDTDFLVCGTVVNGPTPAGKFLLAAFDTNGNPRSGAPVQTDPLSPAATGGQMHDVLESPDGAIIQIGTSSNQHGYVITVVRWKPNGELDTAFGVQGRAHVPRSIYGPVDAASGVMHPDGKFTVCTSILNPYDPSRQYDVLLVKYQANGAVDSSFGTNGMVLIDFSGLFEKTNDMLLQPDGKLVVSVQVGYDHLKVLRLNANGIPDASFGSSGIVDLQAPIGIVKGGPIARLSDGRILVGGSQHNAFGQQTRAEDWIVYCLKPDGQPDHSFSPNGVWKANLPFANGVFTQLKQMLVYPDGKLLLSGTILDKDAMLRLNEESLNIREGNPSHISLYPNPARGSIYLRAPNLSDGPYNFRICAADGSVISANVLQVGKGLSIVEIGHLPAGVYFFVMTADSERISVPLLVY